MTKATSRGGPDTKSRDVAGSGKSGFPIVQLEGRDAKHVFFLEAEKKENHEKSVFLCFFAIRHSPARGQLVAWNGPCFSKSPETTFSIWSSAHLCVPCAALGALGGPSWRKVT